MAVPVRSPIIEDVNVFCPAMVCAKVVIKPVEPEPAIGMLNVCEDPTELMLKKAPEVPVSSVWVPTLIPFSVVIPTAAVGDQVNPVAEEEFAVNT